jgi:hypothetical protein
MKDRVDKSMGIVTHITEVVTRIKPTESLRLGSEIPNLKSVKFASPTVCLFCIRIKKGEDQREKCHTTTIRGKKNRYN